MENNQKQTEFEYPETVKKGTGGLGKYFLIPVVALILGGAIVGMANGKQEYSPLTPTAQKLYETTRTAWCESVKNLAGAKLHDYVNKVLDLPSAELSGLAEKRDMNCQNF